MSITILITSHFGEKVPNNHFHRNIHDCFSSKINSWFTTLLSWLKKSRGNDKVLAAKVLNSSGLGVFAQVLDTFTTSFLVITSICVQYVLVFIYVVGLRQSSFSKITEAWVRNLVESDLKFLSRSYYLTSKFDGRNCSWNPLLLSVTVKFTSLRRWVKQVRLFLKYYFRVVIKPQLSIKRKQLTLSTGGSPASDNISQAWIYPPIGVSV